MGSDGSSLRDAAQQVLASLLDIGRTRLELVTVELEQERIRIARLWILATVSLFLLFVGLVLGAGWIVLLCEPQDRVLALGLLSLSFLLTAAVAAWYWRRLATGRPPLLSSTLDELRLDGAALNQAHGR